MLCFYLYLVLILFEAKFHEIKQCSIKGYKQEGILIVTHCNTLLWIICSSEVFSADTDVKALSSCVQSHLLKTVIKPLFKSINICPLLPKYQNSTSPFRNTV